MTRHRTSLAPLLIAAGLAAAAAGLGGCGASQSGTILIITLEGVNAGDRLPALDSLASAGWSAERARTVSPDSAAAAATLMTGRGISDHGVTDGALGRLRPGVKPLAMALREKGWKTGAFIGTRAIGWQSGLARGFERFDEAPGSGVVTTGSSSISSDRGWDPSGRRREPMECAQEALRWLRTQEGPAFVWVHIAAAPEPSPLPGKAPWGPDEVAKSIAPVGAVLDFLLQGLDDLGRRAHATIAVAGLTGWARGRHGEWTSGLTLAGEVVHVPLVVTTPGGSRELATGDATTGEVWERIAAAAGLVAASAPTAPPATETHLPLSTHGWDCLVLKEGAPQSMGPECACPGAPASSGNDMLRQQVQAALISAGAAMASKDDAGLSAAEAALAAGLRVDPADPALNRLRALLARRRGDEAGVSAALKPMRDRIAAAPAGSACAAATALSLAATLDALGKAPEAAGVLRAAAVSPAALPRLQIALAEEQERAGDGGAASDTLKALAQDELDDARLQERLGDLYLGVGYGYRAAAAYEAAMAAGLRTTGILLKLGDCRLQLKDSAGALELFQEAAAADPKLSAAHIKAGDALLALDRKDEALEELRQALPESASGLEEGMRLADRVAAGGHDEVAFVLYEQLAHLEPRRFEPHFRIGEIMLRRGRLPEAAAAFDYAAGLAPDQPLIPYQQARVAIARKDDAAALAAVGAMTAKAPPPLLRQMAADPAFASLPKDSPVRAALDRAGAPPPGPQQSPDTEP